MLITRSVKALRKHLADWKQQAESIALVPTMGNLHDGHLSLVRAAKEQATRTVVSIFVNPLQFAPNEDFASYPRTFAEDIDKLRQYQVDAVFAPDVGEMYPDNEISSTYIDVPGLSDCLEGEYRPGFFRGVATVVNKLFNMVQPDIAFFGEKDYQQLLVIRKMVKDLYIPVEIQSVATVRETDGLAMSSRNQYLQPVQRMQSGIIYQAMQTVRDQVMQGANFTDIEQQMIQQLTQQGFVVDYLTLREPVSLQKPDCTDSLNYLEKAGSKVCNSLIILAAVRLGTTRLIDNLRFSLKPVDR